MIQPFCLVLHFLRHCLAPPLFFLPYWKSFFPSTLLRNVGKNVDALIKAPTRWGSPIEVSLHELPSMSCKKCGKAMTVKNGRYGSFYGCTSFPVCTYTEDIAEQHLGSIAWLIKTPCRNCGGQMAVKTNRKDAWLVC